VRNWASIIIDLVTFGSPWFRNGAIYVGNLKEIGSADDGPTSCPNLV